MFIHERCQTEEDRWKLATELFHEALGFKTVEVDWIAKLSIKYITWSLESIKHYPSSFRLESLRKCVEHEAKCYKRDFADFTGCPYWSESNDNFPPSFSDLC